MKIAGTMKIVGMVLGFSCTALAQVQNMEIITLFGPNTTSQVTLSGPNGPIPPPIPGKTGLSEQISYGYQLHAFSAGTLFLELPTLWQFGGNVAAAAPGNLASFRRTNWFFTPGVRFKIPTPTRISFYAAIGGGVATFNEMDARINGQLVASSTGDSGFSPAFDFGGGIDFRITYWLSFRAEGRDYITSSGYGGTAGSNHPQFLAGLAFHF
jgi:hypothetical protein